MRPGAMHPLLGRTSKAVVAAALLLVAGCGGGGDDGGGDGAGGEGRVEVLPFEQVQDGELVFEADPTDPSRAVFRVVTTEPMICAIVWGEDESFGRFNNSLSMNGTGIVDHDVLLPDVEAGVAYSYVVQGTTADGTLYRSDVGSFTIDPATTATTAPGSSGQDEQGGQGGQGENLARDATVTDVSSEFSDAFTAANAIDGDTDTEWATAGDGDDGYITVDLGRPRDVATVEFVTRAMADGSAITSTYTVSVDGAASLGPFPAGTLADPRPADLDVSGQVLRFEIESSSGGNVGAVEISLFAPAAG